MLSKEIIFSIRKPRHVNYEDQFFTWSFKIFNRLSWILIESGSICLLGPWTILRWEMKGKTATLLMMTFTYCSVWYLYDVFLPHSYICHLVRWWDSGGGWRANKRDEMMIISTRFLTLSTKQNFITSSCYICVTNLNKLHIYMNL